MEARSDPLLSFVTDVASCLENEPSLRENPTLSIIFLAMPLQRILKYGLSPRKVRPAA